VLPRRLAAALLLALAATPAAADLDSFVWRNRPVPELRFRDGAGAERTLAEFRGRLVLLNLWATWCAPCREEMPSLDRLQATLGGDRFQVVALSIDAGGVPAIRDFFAELGIARLAIYVDETMEAPSTLGVFGIPTTLLVAPEGFEIGRLVGPAAWDTPEALDLIRGWMPAGGE
jgi:thiol-disulfide isomerase/thioredoxin